MNDENGGAQSRLRESVSALVDGEADELELRRVLASADALDVRDVWRDYHLQRDMLAGVDMQFARIDISQRVQAALIGEDVPSIAAGGRWWRPLASVAVAASVATVVVMGARSWNSADNDSALAQTHPVVSLPLSQPVASSVGGVAVGAQLGGFVSNPAAQPVALNPDQFAQQRLQQYLLRHTERAAFNNGQGVIGFAKVAELNNAQQ